MPSEKLRTVADLEQHKLIENGQRDEIEDVIRQYSLEVTPHVLELINSDDKDGAIAAQFIPSVKELDLQESELADPIGDSANSPLPGIIHRYKDRVLLNAIQSCAVYCRFCFRRENVGPGVKGLTPAQVDSAIDYIRDNKEVWEVILSGGDPLMLSSRRLEHIVKRLSSIDHVGIIRFHTRVPCVAPAKVTPELISALTIHRAVYVIIHINHVDELTPEVCHRLSLMTGAGIQLLSQTVLLKSINDNAETLTRLFRKLLENRVKPYYLHHADMAKGTSHFRTSIEEGQEIMKKLRGPVSGLCQPHYVLDIPGGHGKVPINHQYLKRDSTDRYKVEDVFGDTQEYIDSSC